MSTKEEVEHSIERLKTHVSDILEHNSRLRGKVHDLRHDIRDKVEYVTTELFTNNMGHAPGKLIIVDYWGNTVGEWTPETLLEYLQGRLL